MLNTQQVTGAWHEIRGKVREKWGQLTDDDVRMVSGNIEQLVGRIQQKTGEARSEIEDFLNDLVAGDSGFSRAAEAAKGYAQEAAQTVREGYEQVAHQAQEGYEGARDLVRDRPAQSMAMVFAGGVLAGLVVGLLLRSD